MDRSNTASYVLRTILFRSGALQYASSLAFEGPHGTNRLFVVDPWSNQIMVYDAASPVTSFGSHGRLDGQFRRVMDIAIDHEHDRIFLADCDNHRVQVWSLSSLEFVSSIGRGGSGELEFMHPEGVAIDKLHRRLIVSDTINDRLVFVSLDDLSFVRTVGGKQVSQFSAPLGVAIDYDRHRLIVCDANNHRVQVLSLIDGSFLFEFGSQGNQPGQLDTPHAVCIDNQGRIIVADYNNRRLQAFTHDGHHISFFDCGSERPYGVAFDEHRDLVAVAAFRRVYILDEKQWLTDTFVWSPNRHRYAPSSMKQAILTMTMIRSLVDESVLSMIPNEILFEIFSYLDAVNVSSSSSSQSDRCGSSKKKNKCIIA